MLFWRAQGGAHDRDETDAMRIGLVGCGYWGKNLLRNFHGLGVLVAVCEPSKAHHAVVKALAPDLPILEHFEQLLGLDLNGVVIATPAVSHFELARRALRHGLDVFVEKPLALDLEQGRILVREAGDRILMVGHILEYHPACVRLVEMVRGGVLGELRYIYSNRLSLGKVRAEENILWSFAPHDIALMNRLVDFLPGTVRASGGGYVRPAVADVTVTTLDYPGGVKGHVHVSWLHPFKEQRLVVIGSQRMAVFDGVQGSLMLYDQRVEWQRGEPVPISAPGERVEVATEEPLRLECEAFLESIRTRIPPLTDGRSGLAVLSVLEAAQKSLEAKGLPVVVEAP